jgi:hypothetical protein
VTQLLSIGILLAIAGTAAADIVARPVKARLDRPERFAVAGREFTTAVTIEAAADATLRDVEIKGEGWTISRWDGSRELTLAAGGSLRWTLSATPDAGFGPLVLSALVDGKPWRQSFDPSREAYGGLLPTDSDLVPPRRIRAAEGEQFRGTPQLTMAELTAMAADEPPSAVPIDKDRTTCNVYGNLWYLHGTQSTLLPAFGATVWILVVPASGLPYPVGTQRVDETGRFEIDVPAGSTFRICMAAVSNAVVVQEDGLWEDNYTWTTTNYTLPANATSYNAAIVFPTSHHGALHICTDLTYTHNQTRDIGWDVSRTDVQWPDDDGSFYIPDFNEIHYERDDAWNDGTICHEWGHYWHEMHAHYISFDYCNDVCDDPGDCGHCLWCPENLEVAWMEGCAQIISRISTQYLAERVQFNVVHKGVGAVTDDPGCDWDAWSIEGAFAGAVWDMADDDYGTESDHFRFDSLGEDVYDRLDLEVVDILNIMAQDCDVEGHEPYRATGFFRCAAEYLDELGSPQATRAMLWETAWNFDLQIDEQSPGMVPGLTASFPVGTPTQIANGTFHWQQPWDDMSGACAYSVQLTEGHTLTPDRIVDTTHLWWEPEDQLAPGTYYFSVLAVDRAGRWSSVAGNYGPIVIIAPGPSDLEPMTPAGWTASLVLRNSTVSVIEPVLQTSLVNGSSVYFNWGERNVGIGTSGNFVDVMHLDGSPVYTSTVRLLNTGVTNAPRNNGPVNLGAIGRHTVWVREDGLNNAAESDEDNNIYAKQFVFAPQDLDLGETIARTGGLPDATAGQGMLPIGSTFYPNGDGFEIELCLFPELVWAVPDDADDRIVLRLHPHDINQTGFMTPLATSTSLADLPATVIQNPSETIMTNYCVGVLDDDGSGADYRIHREIGQFFAMPDTMPGSLSTADCLDFYLTYNELGEEAWFTIKLANASTRDLQLRFFEPGFAAGSLANADALVTAAAGDTVHHSVLLPPGAMALTVVTRDPRPAGSSPYTVFAYRAKSDPATTVPDGWYANVVPQIGTPYNAAADDIPAPTALTGNSAATGIYWSLSNESAEAAVPIGLSHSLYLDGTSFLNGTFIEAISPSHVVKAVRSTLLNVRGGRHALTHSVNSNAGVDEDDWTNNRQGRQWVWSAQTLTANTTYQLPAPTNPFGGLALVTAGTVAPNCDGYRPSTPVMPSLPTIVAAYAWDDVLDVDLGIYASAAVQEGYTSDYALSQWSGPGCDFVLRGIATHGTATFNLGVVRAGGQSTGDFTLATKTTTDAWATPIGRWLAGTVEAGSYLDAIRLDLPEGTYVFTLTSTDVELGFSLHDFSFGATGKTEPWQDGIAWQTPETGTQDATFAVTIPATGAPSEFALVVWRTDGTTAATAGGWRVTVGQDVTGIDDDDQVPGAVAVSRLVAATPNPFNPSTEVAYEVARAGRCELTVHDVRGRQIRTLLDGELTAGRHVAAWNGLDDHGQRVPSGIYMVRLRSAGGGEDLLKLTLVK